LPLGAFGAGDADSSETFTVAVIAANRLRSDHRQIVCDAIPTAITPRTATSSVDEVFRNRDNDIYRNVRAIARDPTIALDYLTDTEREEFSFMQHLRHEVTLFEDYSKDTVFLWRAANGLLPVIGAYPNLVSRAGLAAYQDGRSDLYRLAAANEIRYTGGKMDRATLLDQASVSNFNTQFHATAATPGWLTETGGPNITFETTVAPPLDPNDANWNAEVLKGVQRVELDDTEAIKCNVGTIGTSALTYVGHALIKGVGKITMKLRTGVGSPSTVRATETYTVDSDTFTVLSVSGASVGGDNRIDIEIEANDGQCVLFISASQIEQGSAPSAYIQTLGAGGSSNADLLWFTLDLPLTGTVGFWWFYPENAETGVYALFESTLSAKFSVRYNVATDVFQFFTDSTGASQLASTTANLVEDTWYHVAVTWSHSSTVDGEMDREIFLNGVSIGSDSTSDWSKDWGSNYAFTKTSTATGRGFRFQELRVDNVAHDATELGIWYDRLEETNWRQAMLTYAGRRYQIMSTTEEWLDVVNTDKFRVNARLLESGTDPAAIFLDR
jgi:hypothetical protein